CAGSKPGTTRLRSSCRGAVERTQAATGRERRCFRTPVVTQAYNRGGGMPDPSNSSPASQPEIALAEWFSLAGKVAVVTGGSRGLGKEMAAALAAAGAKVAISARREPWLRAAQEEFAAAGYDCLAAPCDVADEAQAQAF